MKSLKVLLALVIGSVIISCSNVDSTSDSPSDNVLQKQQTDLSGKKAIDKINIDKLIKSRQEKIKELETESGLSFKKNFVIGEMVDNSFKLKKGIVYDILKLNYELNSLKVGYNIEFNDYEFVSKEENNGYNMLILKGIDKISKNNIGVAMDVIYNPDNNTYIVDPNPPTVVCTGCSHGCSPRRDENGDGYCTSCTSPGNCVKTETLE